MTRSLGLMHFFDAADASADFLALIGRLLQVGVLAPLAGGVGVRAQKNSCGDDLRALATDSANARHKYKS